MVPKYLIQKVLKTSEISFGHKINFKNVHKNAQNIQYKKEPCNVYFLYTSIHVPGVHCTAKICISKSPSTYLQINKHTFICAYQNMYILRKIGVQTLIDHQDSQE